MSTNQSRAFTTKDDIEGWLISAIARSLKIDPNEIETSVAFDRYGMDSARAVELTGDLEERIGQTLSPTLMYDYPTIDALTEHLSGELTLGGEALLAEAS
jgi:acyl carrier protein